MKIREVDAKYFKYDEHVDLEEMTAALLDGEILGSHTLNTILYHAGLLDEDVICTGVSCGDCPYNPSHSDSALDCAELSSAYVRQTILDKVHKRTSVEDML